MYSVYLAVVNSEAIPKKHCDQSVNKTVSSNLTWWVISTLPSENTAAAAYLTERPGHKIFNPFTAVVVYSFSMRCLYSAGMRQPETPAL